MSKGLLRRIVIKKELEGGEDQNQKAARSENTDVQPKEIC